jgi:hypothetical protein
MNARLLIFIALSWPIFVFSQLSGIDKYNIVWNSQSNNSGESMPAGGGDIGLNVWVEKGDILFYIAKSGTFDENNGFPKLGRVRIRFSPNPFNGKNFKQELVLKNGYIVIYGNHEGVEAKAIIWVDVYQPVVHFDIKTTKPVKAEIYYENWRYSNHLMHDAESFATSLKWAPFKNLVIKKDSIAFFNNGVLFFHRNTDPTVFDITVHQQFLDSVKSQLFNPLKNLTFGGFIQGQNLEPANISSGKYLDTDFKAWQLISKKPAKEYHLEIILHVQNAVTLDDWKKGLQKNIENNKLCSNDAFAKTIEWWHNYWNRSFIIIQPESPDENSFEWQVGRNYQLFRYMLGCNAYGSYPTKFNGGLFTFDPCFVDSSRNYTPDYRNWGGGIFTAQNQRLVYFPMLKSGDFDMMKSQFNFYVQMLPNAELRSEIYWKHKGACFTEQIENFGLPNCTEYGWNRPEWFDKGVEYNAWLEYQWDTSLEFCLMILETWQYARYDITEYIPLIESCLTFFYEHYQYLARLRGIKTFDQNGHLILYPGSACETYKMAYNSTSTISALQTILKRMTELPPEYVSDSAKEVYNNMLKRIPPINFRQCEGHVTIAPAKLWERTNNTESPQLYPVFPWGIYGIGKPGLDTAINTWKYDPDVVKFRDFVGWKQDNIFAARLGLTDEAAKLTLMKLKDSGRRFPAFWGPGFDWTPDHNWGGSGMIGLQEMLIQTDKEKIYLFPAWPPEWNVHFKLHAPFNTTIEAIVRNGKIEVLKIMPETRKKDVIIMLDTYKTQ